MRTRRFLTIAVLLFSGLITADLASADSWDYVYGEDPTNANNVSGFTDVRADPLGGAFVAGYFFGAFEGLDSNGRWAKFIQHRNEFGAVDWTYLYDSVTGSSPPLAPQLMIVDGAGTLFLQGASNNSSAINVASITRSGVWTQGSDVGSPTNSSTIVPPTTPSNRSAICHSYLADGVEGLLAICGDSLRKFDSAFNVIWSADVASRLGGQNEAPLGGNSNTGLLVQGSGNSVWIVANFNTANWSSDQSQLPQIYRTYMGLTNYSSSTGAEIRAIKHYGLIGFDAYAAGERNLWVHTKSIPSTQERITVFKASNGEKVGSVDSRFGLYGPNWDGTMSDLESMLRVSDTYGFGARDNSAANVCTYQLFVGDRWDFPRGPVCYSGPMASDVSAQIVFTNDGRRVAMSNKNRLWVFELDGEDLPKIGRLVMRKDFEATISSFDMDDFGNIYVVGKTFTSSVVAASERSAQSAFTSSRGFIVRNPSGAMGLTVLPRTPLRFKVTGTNGVPASGVGAVSMNVTVTTPQGEGFVTVFPCDSRPDASNLNYVLNQTVPNAVIAPVSANGEVCFYTFAQTHLIADVNGYFPSGSGFVSNTPARVFDTRVGSAQGLRTVSKTKVGDGTELRVQFTNLPGGITPATGVGAVSLNVTVTGSQAPAAGGFVTVYPCGNRPEASNLNFVSNQIVPNAVITPVSANGEVCFYVFGSTDLIADINGYFPSGAGFVATDPVRVADTRVGSAQGLRTVTKQRIGGNTTLQLQLTNLPGGITPASGIGAVSLNVTAVNTTANEYGGYVTTYPCGALPDVSSLNFVSNQIVPNAVIAPLSVNGTICFYAYGQTDLIVDLNGYFPTGAGFVPVNPKRMFDTR
jgi:hypothetical protein